METRRTINAALPRPLVAAQYGLYLWAAYAVGWGVMTGELPGWELLFAFARFLAAYGIANESRFGYWIAIVTTVVTIIPALDLAVHDPWLLVQPDYLVLLVMPLVILFLLTTPASRDHVRAWFR